MSPQPQVTWVPIDLYLRGELPSRDKLVWIFEPNLYGFATVGYFDGYVFQNWQGEVVEATHWAPVTYPEMPYVP